MRMGSTARLPAEGDPDEAMPRLVRRNPSKPVTKYCINCLSPLEKGSQLGGWLLPQDYFCKKCGYKGYVFLEDRRSEDEAERAAKGAAADESHEH